MTLIVFEKTYRRCTVDSDDFNLVTYLKHTKEKRTLVRLSDLRDKCNVVHEAVAIKFILQNIRTKRRLKKSRKLTFSFFL